MPVVPGELTGHGFSVSVHESSARASGGADTIRITISERVALAPEERGSVTVDTCDSVWRRDGEYGVAVVCWLLGDGELGVGLGLGGAPVRGKLTAYLELTLHCITLQVVR